MYTAVSPLRRNQWELSSFGIPRAYFVVVSLLSFRNQTAVDIKWLHAFFYQRLFFEDFDFDILDYFNWFMNGSFEHMLLLKHEVKIRRKTYYMIFCFYINLVTFMYIFMLKIIFRLCARFKYSFWNKKREVFRIGIFLAEVIRWKKKFFSLTISYTRRHRHRYKCRCLCDKNAKFGPNQLNLMRFNS